MRQPICAWLKGKRVLLLDRTDNSAEIVKDGKIQKIEGKQLALISCVAPSPEPQADEPAAKQRRPCDPIAELRRELIRRPGLARSTAKAMGISEAVADEVAAELLDGFELPTTKAAQKVLAYAENEVVPRARLGQSPREIARETQRDFKTVDCALQRWHFQHFGEHLEPREIAFRLNRDQLDKHKLGFHSPLPTERSAAQVAKNKARRLEGAAQRRLLNKRIDELMGKCVSAVKSRPVGGRRVTCAV